MPTSRQPPPAQTLRLVQSLDWTTTPLGPIEHWPQSLRTSVDIMLASHHAMCLAWGPEHTFLYNDAYAPMLGGRHPMAMGLPFQRVWPDVWDSVEPLIRQVMAGEAVSFRDYHLLMTRNGFDEDTWWDFCYSPIRDEAGVVQGLLNVTLEATGRVVAAQQRDQANQQLRDSEARLRALVNASSDVVYTMNADWTELRHLDGRGFIAEIDAPSVDWIETYLLEEDRPALRAAIDEAIATRGVFALEHRVRRADGGVGWTFSRAVPMLDANGQVTEWFGMAADVTARREAQETLRHFNDALETRVEERSRELRASEDRVRQMQKMEAIGQLTGGVAHDFNNLLTIIRSSADLLRRKQLAPERQRRYIDAISDTADRAAKLTGQLLAFARQQALKPEVFDVPTRLASITDMIRTVLGARIRLALETDGTSCAVEADTTQFETSIVNMAVNARDAMNAEGVLTIGVQTTLSIPALRGHSAVSGPFVKIWLTDTGSGIDAQILDRIFDPFFTTKEVGKGTGLGLSQVYGFAKQSGGDVNVVSRPGQGSTFEIFLPLVEAPSERHGESMIEAELASRGTVLIVEDNANVREFALQLLEDLGYQTRQAANAGEATALLECDHAQIDVVFSDVVMPGESGVDLARRIKARWPRIPVVLTSGYSHVLAADLRHGFHLLQKPYSVEELSRVLRDARAP